MPDLGELLLVLVVGAVAAAFIATPLVRRSRAQAPRAPGTPNAAPGAPGDAPAEAPAESPDLEALTIRHRVALEAIRDVEADRRAGSLDDAAYAEQRAEAEQRAVETLAELDAARAQAGQRGPAAPAASAPSRSPVPTRWVAIGAGVLALAVLGGLFLPAPFSLANPTETNQALAQQLAAERVRQATIADLLGRVQANPRDTASLSKLADAYLQGGTANDLASAGRALLLLISLEPRNTSAYQRLITAYIDYGDWTDAAAATNSYARIATTAATAPDIPFFRGLIALRGSGDRAEAAKQFRSFLALAPNDPRATMVRALLQEAAPSGSAAASPSP